MLLVPIILVVLADPSHLGGRRAADDFVAPSRIAWDARAVEHLLNRAAFGATESEIARGLALGPERLVERLVNGGSGWVDVEPELFRWEDFGLDHMQVTLESSDYFRRSAAEQIGMCKDARVVDRDQFLALHERWFASIVAGNDPLRDRMTLFWHGFFTTSWEVVKRKYEIIHQFQWLRRESLGSYAELLRGIVRDPAMLQFLDQTASSKEHPNENLARELLELFSLGEGNYTEHDVREAARALTGNRCNSSGSFEFLVDAHDDGPKTILGRTERFGDRELVDHVLSQAACSRWIARRILRWIEGLEPAPERLERYATLLRRAHFELRPFLRTLFLDPDFYREEVVGSRVLSPQEYLAFVCHKLDLAPNGHFLNKAGVILGQAFYWPPSVKGWPEGLDWIANDALLRRGNVVGALVGALDGDLGDNAARSGLTGTLEASSGGEAPKDFGARGLDLEALLEALGEARWSPSEVFLARLARLGTHSDAEIVDALLREWLSGPPATATPGIVRACLALERERLGAAEGVWLSMPRERVVLLRRLAHLIFSLPEAHLG